MSNAIDGLKQLSSGYVHVTAELVNELMRIKGENGWRVFSDIDGWPGSHTLASNICNGRQTFTKREVYECVGLAPPSAFELHLEPGVSLIGNGPAILSESNWVSLENTKGQNLIGVIIPTEMTGECLVCKSPFLRTPPNRLYCNQHSYGTKEGRRYQRRQRFDGKGIA